MCSLRPKVEEQFQLYLEFLGPNAIVLRNSNLPVTLKHVENSIPSLKVYV
jgi:hypothetical protein